MASHFVVGLDIGSKNLRAAVAEVKKSDRYSLVSLIKVPARGFLRGAVDDISDATHSLSQLLSEVKKISPRACKSIILGISTPDIKVLRSRGVVAVSRADNEIYEDDIQRVENSAEAVSLPTNREPVERVIQEYIVDGVENIRDPLGMVGKRLELNMLIVHAFTPSLKGIERTLETLGARIAERTVGPLAASRAVLSKGQLELGVVLVDIGSATTGICVFEENRLLHAAVLPFGSANITNDLAIGLRIPVETAETIKLSYGSAIAKEVPARDTLELEKIDPRVKGEVSKRFIAEIIESRLAEIFEQVVSEVKKIEKANQLPGGVVFVGAGAKTPNLLELARKEMKLPAQIGVPDLSHLNSLSSEINLQAEDPEFATAIGLLLRQGSEESLYEQKRGGRSGFLKKFLGYFVP